MSFNLSKLIQTFIEPANALALLLLLAALLSVSRWEQVQHKARRLVLILALLIAFIAAFPVGEWALLPLENRYAKSGLPPNVDGIILLTGDENPAATALRGQPVGGAATSRYIHLAHLSQRYPKARLIVSGNTAPNYKSKVTTQTVSRQIIAATTLDKARVTFEDQSLTTYDNARLTARLIKPRKDEVWLVVTSAWHMPRAILCFDHQNMKVHPAPTDYLTSGHMHFAPHLNLSRQLHLLRLATHEYYGLLGYWLTGRIERPWK